MRRFFVFFSWLSLFLFISVQILSRNPFIHAQQSLQEIKIGTLFPFSIKDTSLRLAAPNFWNGVQLALREMEPIAAAKRVRFTIVNEDYAKFVPSEQNPNFYTLVLNATMGLVRNNVQGMIGPLLRHFPPSIVDVSTNFRIPFCNLDFSLPGLPNTQLYPYYFDSSPSIDSLATYIVDLFQSLRWTRFLIFYSNDDFSSGLKTALKFQSILNPKLDTQAIPFMENMSNPNLDVSLDIASMYHYRVFMVTATGERRTAMVEAIYKRKLFRPGYTWVFIGSINATIEKIAPPSELPRLFSEHSPLRGTFMLNALAYSPRMKSYQLFEKKYNAMFSGDAQRATDAYLCAVSLMQGLLKTKGSMDTFNLTQFLETDWVGPGGRIQYNANGSLHTNMEILNWQNAGPIVVANYDPVTERLNLNQPLFSTGTHSPHSDLPQLVNITLRLMSGHGLTLLAICVLLFVLCVVCMCMYMLNANHDLIKPASATYTTAMLFGLALLLACIVLQTLINLPRFCDLSLVTGLLGTGCVLAPLLAKNFLILHVYDHPFSLVLPKKSNPASQNSSFYSRFSLPSRPNLVALFVLFIELLLSLLFIFVTPIEGRVEAIDKFTSAYLCVHKQAEGSPRPAIRQITQNPLFYVIVFFHLFLLVWLLWFSWKSQKVTEKKLKFTRTLGITTYTFSFIGLLILLSWALDHLLYPISFWIRALGLLLLIVQQLFLFVFPPLRQLYMQQSRARWTARIASPSDALLQPARTTTPQTSSRSPREYEGRLLYFTGGSVKQKKTGWRSMLDFHFHPNDSWKWVEVKAIPAFHALYVMELDITVYYETVQFSPALFETPLTSTPVGPHASSIITSLNTFELITKDKKSYAFWTSKEQDARKWISILDGKKNLTHGRPSIHSSSSSSTSSSSSSSASSSSSSSRRSSRA